MAAFFSANDGVFCWRLKRWSIATVLEEFPCYITTCVNWTWRRMLISSTCCMEEFAIITWWLCIKTCCWWYIIKVPSIVVASLFRNTPNFSMTSYNLFLPARRMPQTRRRQGGVGQLFRELEKVHTTSQLDGNPQSQQPELRTDRQNHVALQYMDEPKRTQLCWKEP